MELPISGFVRGILVMMCLLGPLSAGHSMLTELNGGQMERFLVTPISRTSLIGGRTVKDSIVTQMLIFPITLLSGILLFVDAGPGWLQAVAAVNPVAYIIDGARALFTGHFVNTAVLYGTLSAAIAIVGLILSTRAMNRGI